MCDSCCPARDSLLPCDPRQVKWSVLGHSVYSGRARAWLKSRVLARGHIVYNVNFWQCGLSLAKIKGTFLHTSGFKSAFHFSSNCLLQKATVIKEAGETKKTLLLEFHKHTDIKPPLLFFWYNIGYTYLTKEAPFSCNTYYYNNYKSYLSWDSCFKEHALGKTNLHQHC